MTTPDERTRAVMQTRGFLQELAWAAADSGVSEPVRKEANRLLRHYPSGSNMDLAHQALPQWFGEVSTGCANARQAGRRPAATKECVEWRVGIVQSLDLDRKQCQLMDSMTEELLVFTAKKNVVRPVLAEISIGSCVDYQIDSRRRVVMLGDLPAKE